MLKKPLFFTLFRRLNMNLVWHNEREARHEFWELPNVSENLFTCMCKLASSWFKNGLKLALRSSTWPQLCSTWPHLCSINDFKTVENQYFHWFLIVFVVFSYVAQVGFKICSGWPQVGSSWPQIGSSWLQVGLSWLLVGLCWPMLGHAGAPKHYKKIFFQQVSLAYQNVSRYL